VNHRELIELCVNIGIDKQGLIAGRSYALHKLDGISLEQEFDRFKTKNKDMAALQSQSVFAGSKQVTEEVFCDLPQYSESHKFNLAVSKEAYVFSGV
jgi:hypothetical protein